MDLRPESSNNYNLGIAYEMVAGENHRLNFDASLNYRNAKDFIRPKLNPNETKQIMGNLADVTNLGIDGEIRYSYKNSLQQVLILPIKTSETIRNMKMAIPL